MTASEIIEKYILFFEERNHKRISNSPLVPQNDPTTLFTSSGMQPLVPYLLGEPHPLGNRLVNVQNCFRAQDIEEIGDNRHTTFFRMLGNWSLGDYFKKEQIHWIFEFITKELGISANQLYVSAFSGFNTIPKDNEAAKIWKGIFENEGLDFKKRIFYYSSGNWWSRSGLPENMPPIEPGGPDSEIFFDFQTPHDPKFGKTCHVNCDCGRFFEISNSVFMQYQKQESGNFAPLPKQNIDHGAGLERLLAAVENKPDIFETSLFLPIIRNIEQQIQKKYKDHARHFRIIADHFIGATFIIQNNVIPSNKEQGYILRRLIRRGLDTFYQLGGKEISPILETITHVYSVTDPDLQSVFETTKYTILEEEERYKKTRSEAKLFIEKKYKGKQIGDEIKGVTEISSLDAFILYSTHGLSPTQIKSLGFIFNEKEFAEKMKDHQALSRQGAEQKFKGGLADTSEKTIMGHTATHLLHQAIRDIMGKQVHQTGSNITSQRLRFDFNYDQILTDEQILTIEGMVNDKIKQALPVHFEMIKTAQAKKMGAIGLFEDTYSEESKIYFIGGSSKKPTEAYSIEFCGGPHVKNTKVLKRFTLYKQENLGKGQKRIYAKIG